MKGRMFLGFLVMACAVAFTAPGVMAGSDCVGCHEKVTPGIVKDYARSAMSEADLSCDTCHGSEHTSAADLDKVKLPTPETCKMCHKEKYDQYAAGKHALAWVAMSAMPTNSIQPHPYIEGQKW